MIIVRTVREDDIDGVMALAQKAFPGMTTLPPDRDVLLKKLQQSVASIGRDVSAPADETYFLVMEDIENKRIVGTAAVIACLGSVDEFYSYKLNKVTHSCKELDKKITFETMNLSNHFEGFSEVATLYLDAEYRQHGNGKFLAQSRYLFMAQFRSRFPESVMADLRGYFDDHGRSPFWDAVGKHFFEMGFAEADLYGAINGNQFIADLMPKQPLYVNLLPQSAQDVIGQPNVNGKAALAMLHKEGFRWNGHVDIFDAAPSVDTKIDDMVSVENSRTATVSNVCSPEQSQTALVANNDINQFVVCASPIQFEQDKICLPAETISALHLSTGDEFRYLLLS